MKYLIYEDNNEENLNPYLDSDPKIFVKWGQDIARPVLSNCIGLTA
jgi:hypothetical protein